MTGTVWPRARWAAPFPRWGWWGLLLIAVFWPVNWFWPGLRTHLAFFPLWLGYALTMDALAYRQKGTSLIARSARRFAFLFLLSAPVWWLFEAFNVRLQNWQYLGREYFDDLTYGLLATLAFSTVMPAVFATVEWMAGHAWVQRLRHGPVVRLGPRAPWLMALLGLLGVALLLAWPRFFFPLVWVAPYLLVEAFNLARGYPTALQGLARGDWRVPGVVALGTLFTGFFWELWNVFSYPKWVYDVPFVDFLHLFEMPLLGYLGYLPFGLELFAFYHAVMGLLGHPQDDYLLQGLHAAFRRHSGEA